MLTEESEFKIEDTQSSIITALTDKFDVVEQEHNDNYLFRTLSIDYLGSSTYLCMMWDSK